MCRGLGFPLPVPFHHCSILNFIYTFPVREGQTGGAWRPSESAVLPADGDYQESTLAYSLRNLTANAIQTIPRHSSLVQVALQAYFFLAFGCDFFEPNNGVLVKRLKKALRFFKAVVYSSDVLPTTVVSRVSSDSLEGLSFFRSLQSLISFRNIHYFRNVYVISLFKLIKISSIQVLFYQEFYFLEQNFFRALNLVLITETLVSKPGEAPLTCSHHVHYSLCLSFTK